MSRLKKLIQDAPVHERRLQLRTYPAKDGCFIAEGWLFDERLAPGFHWDGRLRSPGRIHRMCARLLVGNRPLTILDAEAEMPGVPFELCLTTTESLQKIIGVKIVSGYSDRIREILGGIEGCAHLTYLVVALGPAALHGYWTHQSRSNRPAPRSVDEFPGLEFLIDSCRLWRKDGPRIQMIREALEKQEKDSDK